MVLSMTGYGRAGALLHGRDIKVELRSVNARFFEYSSRLPRSCAFLEDKLKKLVAAKVSRGKVELSLSIQTVTAADTVVSVNWSLAQGYRAALDSLIEKMDLKNDVTAGMIARFPEVLTQTAAPAAGQYFIRVRATNASGYTQDAFDYYVIDSGKVYGVKCFYIQPDGTVVEDTYEE